MKDMQINDTFHSDLCDFEIEEVITKYISNMKEANICAIISDIGRNRTPDMSVNDIRMYLEKHLEPQKKYNNPVEKYLENGDVIYYSGYITPTCGNDGINTIEIKRGYRNNKCPGCGFCYINEQATYCSRCGAKIKRIN